ncbi:hypothetical protein MP228_000585 [Amoeboaphelidium protococcarum]|nr:hypothetical protein MP228_000585 [Amoeboaphelidium protococcarum]
MAILNSNSEVQAQPTQQPRIHVFIDPNTGRLISDADAFNEPDPRQVEQSRERQTTPADMAEDTVPHPEVNNVSAVTQRLVGRLSVRNSDQVTLEDIDSQIDDLRTYYQRISSHLEDQLSQERRMDETTGEDTVQQNRPQTAGRGPNDIFSRRNSDSHEESVVITNQSLVEESMRSEELANYSRRAMERMMVREREFWQRVDNVINEFTHGRANVNTAASYTEEDFANGVFPEHLQINSSGMYPQSLTQMHQWSANNNNNQDCKSPSEDVDNHPFLRAGSHHLGADRVASKSVSNRLEQIGR